VVILKDGNKYIGKTTDEGDSLRIATPDGEMIVKKDRIKATYKDASAIIKETNDIQTEAKKLIADAIKIEDRKERNVPLDKAIDLLVKAQNICADVLDVFAGKDGEDISKQFTNINYTLKEARSQKVSDKDAPPPKEEKKPAQPPPEPVEPQKPDTEKPQQDEPEPKTADPEKVDAAKEVYNLGLESFNGKKYDEARDFFLKSISYYEDYPEPYAKLGDTYTMLKDEELGYENYKKCLELISHMTIPSEELAKLRDDVLKKTEKFKPIEDKITNLAVETVSKLMGLGKKCLDDEDYLMAEDVFSLILKIEKDNKEAQENMAKVREMLEKE